MVFLSMAHVATKVENVGGAVRRRNCRENNGTHHNARGILHTHLLAV